VKILFESLAAVTQTGVGKFH